MKIHSTSLVIREIKLKPQWDTITHLLTVPNAVEDVKQLELLHIAGRNPMFQLFSKQFGSSLQLHRYLCTTQ